MNDLPVTRIAAPAAPAHGPEAATAKSRPWIPVRSLSEAHRPRILAHLLELTPADRHLRFGHAVSDELLTDYVDHLDFEQDEIFGIFNRRLDLLGMAHLAGLGVGEDGSTQAEFGVSVRPTARGRGFGARLFEHAVLHARNRGVDTLIIQALSENAAMLHIARAAGATVERCGTESEARLKLPPEDIGSHVTALAQDGAAVFDYQWKSQSRRLQSLLTALSDVRERMGHAGAVASE